jgi:hypothetical protein
MNNANIDPSLNQGIPAPQQEARQQVSLMLSEATHPETVAIARRIAQLPDAHEQALKAIKERVKAEIAALNKEFQAKHDAAWTEFQAALGIDPEFNYQLCADHLETHGVVFVTEAEADERRMPNGTDIGSLIAKALGGRMVSGNDDGGVIEVRG